MLRGALDLAPVHFTFGANRRWRLHFVLKAANNQVIGTSEMYSSAAALENGIASVKATALGAPLVDEAA